MLFSCEKSDRGYNLFDFYSLKVRRNATITFRDFRGEILESQSGLLPTRDVPWCCGAEMSKNKQSKTKNKYCKRVSNMRLKLN